MKVFCEMQIPGPSTSRTSHIFIRRAALAPIMAAVEVDVYDEDDNIAIVGLASFSMNREG